MATRIAVVGNINESQWMQKVQAPLTQIGKVYILTKEEILQHKETCQYTIAIIDSSTVGDDPAFIQELKTEHPEIPHLVVTASPTWRRAREMFKAGADDYLKQMDPEKLVQICSKLLAFSFPIFIIQ